MFDPVRFLEEHRVDYKTYRGGVAFQCPFCGEDDRGKHLTWSTENLKWHCWREITHAGHKPHRLVAKLANCTYEQAHDIISRGVNLDTMSTLLQKLKGQTRVEPEPRTLQLPKEFRKLVARGSGEYFTRYLTHKRGFRSGDISALAEAYDLRFCTVGQWKNRLIFPLYFKGNLTSWTGRSIGSKSELRYLTLGIDNEVNPALLGVKSLIYGYDQLIAGGAALLVTEGPMDAVKVDFYGKQHGVRATCLFGTGITYDQVVLLSEVRQKFRELLILGDVGALSNVWLLMDRLARLRPRAAALPDNVKDPGELTPKQVKQLAVQLL